MSLWAWNDTYKWAIMRWWYVQRCYDNICNMMIMMYPQWIYDEITTTTKNLNVCRTLLVWLMRHFKTWSENYIYYNLLKPLRTPLTLIHAFSCDAWRHQGSRKICCRGGTPTPHLGGLSSHGHKQLLVRWMGPLCSPQPSIDTLFWCPPAEFGGVTCPPAGCPQKLNWWLLR